MKYVVEAENTGASFGVPFPPLPACLIDASKPASKETAGGYGSAKKKAIGESGRRDSNSEGRCFVTW